MDAAVLTVSWTHFTPTQQPLKRERAKPISPNCRIFRHACGVEDRDHGIDQAIFALMRGGRAFTSVIVPHEHQHTA